MLNLKQLRAYDFHKNVFSQTVLKDSGMNNTNENFRKGTFFIQYIIYIKKKVIDKT